MNPDTGAIAYFETKEDAKKAGHTVQLQKKEAAVLLPLPRPERSPALDKMRRAKRKAQKKARRANRGK